MTNLTHSEILLAVFANQLCIPIPSIFVLMAAGASCARGEMSLGSVLSLSVVGCLAADSIWYLVGVRWGGRALSALCSFAEDPRRSLREARERFRRHGTRMLLVSKFVPGLDAIAPPLIGAEKVSLGLFLASDAAGSLLWSAVYVGAGFFFSRQLEAVAHWVGQFGTAFGVVLGVLIGVWLGWRGLPWLRMIGQLRKRHITASALASKLRANERVAVVDLLQFEAETESGDIAAIPGACGVDPSRLQQAQPIAIPEDVEIVLYCSSGSDAVSAKAALALQRVGIERVWVLEGGLKAWRENQLPVSATLEIPEQVAARLGIALPEIEEES